jgi:hypothetical protein
MSCTTPKDRIIGNDEVRKIRKGLVCGGVRTATRILIAGLWFEILAQDDQNTQQEWRSINESLHNSAYTIFVSIPNSLADKTCLKHHEAWKGM